jgi:hypothetical protein
MTYKIFLGLSLFILLVSGCKDERVSDNSATETVESGIPESLPMTVLPLTDISQLVSTGDNWTIVGAVQSEYDQEANITSAEGTGILLNNIIPDGDHSGANLFTVLEHGDIQLELEVLVPKNSNSGLYLQSRYELQIRDSASDSEVSADDMGGIYASPGKNAQGEDIQIPGHAPAINAARAPGLWQTLSLLFRAPRFDAGGNKIRNARLDYVYLNGYAIHKDLELLSPTLGAIENNEVAKAPLMIQGDHGPVAFRNIKYKAFELEEASLTNLTYALYDGKYDYIPDFSTLEVIKTGEAENFENITDLSEKNDGFSIVFEGTLNVPRDGEYLLETNIDDGGDLFIDDQLVVHNQGEPGWGAERGLIQLTKGDHRLRQSYYQEVWGVTLKIWVEGPGLEKMEIPKLKEPREVPSWARERELKISVGDRPELIRGFVNHGDTKKTHILSVGTPQGVHYSYDTRNNQLINVWRGDFADASRMWINRGESQLLVPSAAVLSLEELNNGAGCKPIGYNLREDGMPSFSYNCDDQIVTEDIAITPDNNVVRSFSINKGSKNLMIAVDESITRLANGAFSIGNRYFIKPIDKDDNWEIVGEELTAQAGPNAPVQFEIYW